MGERERVNVVYRDRMPAFRDRSITARPLRNSENVAGRDRSAAASGDGSAVAEEDNEWLLMTETCLAANSRGVAV